MVRPISARTALLAASVAFIAAVPAGAAAPRTPLETLVRHPLPPSMVDMGDWLRLLAGRFKWDGVLDTQPQEAPENGTDLYSVSGMSDCVTVGAGPGVQCVIDVRWHEGWTLQGRPIAVPNLTPAMILYGIDPVRERLVYLQVDNKGLAIGGPGTLYGNAATLRAPCIGTDLPVQVAATPGSSAFTSSDQGSSGGDGFGSDSSGASDGGQSPGGSRGLVGGEGGTASQSAAGGAKYTAPSSSLSADVDPGLTCVWITRVDANPDKDLIFINIAYGDRADPTNRFALSLRRFKYPNGE